MRKNYFYILPVLFLLTISFSSFAQIETRYKHFTDSIEALVQKTEPDTAKAILLNKLSVFWAQKDSGRAAGYARRSMQLSRGNIYFSALAHYYLGISYYYKKPSKAEKEFQTTIDLLENDSSKRALSLLSKAWKNYGAAHQKVNGDNKTLMQILLNHSIPLAQKAEDKVTEAEDYAALALIYSNLLNYNKAIFYYKKAIRVGKGAQQKKPDILVKFYIRLAQNYLENKQFNRVKPNLDSAWVFLENKPHSIFHIIYYKTLGMYYSQTNQKEQGFFNLDTALKLAKELGLPYMASSIIFEKFRMYDVAKQYSKAKKMLLLVLHDTLISSKPRNKLRLLQNLAQTDAHLGNMTSAYNWLNQYATLADSMHKVNVKSDIAALEVKYKSEKKKRQILSLQNENKQQQLSLQRKRFTISLLIAGVLLLILICVIIFMLYRNKRRRIAQEAKIHEQKLERLRQQNQLKIYNAMIEGQEQERERLARDLHDGLGGLLSGVKLKLSDIADKNKKNMELYKVINQLDGSVQELRRIARNMMPETLLRFGVETALKDLCDSLQTQQTHLDFQAIQLDKGMPQTVQISIYRIVQELLTNAIRHGHAKNILVQCSQNDDRVFITVEDDGHGFDVNLLKDEKGIGMANIKNRINFLKGNFEIDSKPGEGTTVNVEVNAHE